jgi:DNA-binding LacI/PurR family transcriptional regulator
MNKSRATMRDIALVANVSVTTVWMVIHDKPGISPNTAEKVWSVIRDLDYKPRKSDSSSQLDTVGLLIEQSSIPAISDVFYGDVIRGFQNEAEKNGYQVVLSTFNRETQSINRLKAGFVAAVKGYAVANDGDITPETLAQLQSPSVPVVLIESYIDGKEFPCVLGDNLMAGYKIARHLLNLGHREIAVLRGPTKYSSLVDRLRGIVAALAEECILVPEQWMPSPVSGHPHKGYLQMKEILRQERLPTAIIAISDKTAFGAMEAIREVGLRIPEDIAVASIDNTMESRFTRPPLTTVHIPKYELGVLAMQKLDQLIQQEQSIPFKTIVYSELVIRESCGSSRR